MTIPDPMLSFIQVLKAASAVSTLVGTRVFGEELPRTETAAMPRQSVVLSSSGGRFNSETLKVGPYRFNVHCYGATIQQASTLDRAVYETLKHLSRWGSSGRAGILIVVAESGPFVMRDPDTTWPYALTTYRALVGEV